jgi:hypothetical protein
MRKSNLILGALSGLFLLYLVYLDNRTDALDRQLAGNRLQCEQQINRLQGNYRAEIDDLQQYLRLQYDYTPAAVHTQQPQGQQKARTDAGQRGDRNPKGAQTVERKYRYLYDDLPDLREATKDMLQEILLERERLVASGADGEQLGGIEAQIGELLGAEGYQHYQVLKNSDSEQHHLQEYASSISKTAPLTPEQERAILFAKLRHKQIYEDAIREAGVYWRKWSPEELAQVQTTIRKAVDTYKSNYLREARQSLSPAQFAQLSTYETAEFNWELERLFRLIGSKH